MRSVRGLCRPAARILPRRPGGCAKRWRPWHPWPTVDRHSGSPTLYHSPPNRFPEPPVSTAATTVPPAAPARPYSREVDLILVIYLAVIVFAILYPSSFFTRDNLRVILNNLA